MLIPISIQITAIQIHVLTVVRANRLVAVQHAYAQPDSWVNIVKPLTLDKDDIGLIYIMYAMSKCTT